MFRFKRLAAPVLFVGLFVPQMAQAAVFYTVQAIYKDDPERQWQYEGSYIIVPGETAPTALDQARAKADEMFNDPNVLRVRIIRDSDAGPGTNREVPIETLSAPARPAPAPQGITPRPASRMPGATPTPTPTPTPSPSPDLNRKTTIPAPYNPPPIVDPFRSAGPGNPSAATRYAPTSAPASPTVRIVYDDDQPRLPSSPKGVSMRVGIDPSTLQRAEAPSTLLKAIRAAK